VDECKPLVNGIMSGSYLALSGSMTMASFTLACDLTVIAGRDEDGGGIRGLIIFTWQGAAPILVAPMLTLGWLSWALGGG